MQFSGTIRATRSAGVAQVLAHVRLLAAAGRGRLILFLPMLMGVGDLIYFALHREPPAWLGAALLAPPTAAVILARQMPWLRGAFMAGSALALGFAAAQLASVRAPPAVALPTRAALISGTVAAVETLPAGQRITLASAVLAQDAPPLPRLLRIRLRNDDPAAIWPGDVVRLRVLVRPPAPPAYPGGWDLQRDAWFAGIGGYGTALGDLAVVSPAERSVFGTWLQRLRQRIAARAEATVPGPSGAIAATLLSGLSAAIPPADRAAFRDAGLAHLLAIAGLHIGIVMGLIFGLLRFALALSERAALHWPIKEIAALAALAAGLFYLLLTGMHVPILRSFTMAAVVVLALLSGRRAVSLRGLLLAAAALILVEPEQILGVSFQMSFSAVLALIAGYDALRPALRRLHGDGGPGRRFVGHLVALALTSLLAGTASAPFAAYHFGHFQVYYVLANMVAVPLTAFWIMPAGLAALALMPLGWDAPAFAVMGWGLQAVLAIARTVAAWPAATLAVPHMPDWGLAAVAVGLIWLGVWRGRLRPGGALPIALGLLSPLLVRPPDILVSDDARLIALRTPAGGFAETRGADRFVRESWEQYWAIAPLRPLAEAGLSCSDDACLLRARPGDAAALLVRRGAAPPVCAQALMIAAEPLHTSCLAIDRFTVWRDGAQAVWLGETGAAIVSDRQARGARPWVMLGPERRVATTLPMAPTENLDGLDNK